MALSSVSSLASMAPKTNDLAAQQALKRPAAAPSDEQLKLRKSFDTFVGESFYGQMLSAMRKTVDKPAYFHGGQAEETFRGQLDQMLATEMSEASASQFTGPMFDLFTLNRS